MLRQISFLVVSASEWICCHLFVGDISQLFVGGSQLQLLTSLGWGLTSYLHMAVNTHVLWLLRMTTSPLCFFWLVHICYTGIYFSFFFWPFGIFLIILKLNCSVKRLSYFHQHFYTFCSRRVFRLFHPLSWSLNNIFFTSAHFIFPFSAWILVIFFPTFS